MRFGERAGDYAQCSAGPAQSAHQRADWHLQNVGSLLIGQAFKGNQQQGLLLLKRQGLDGAGHFRQGKMPWLRRRRCKFGYGVDIDLLAPPMVGTKRVAIKVQQDGKKPGADRSGGPEQPALGNGAFEAILYQVIGQVDIARQRPGIAPESWNAGFNLVEEMVHGMPRLYSTARCQTPPTPSPLMSPAAMSSYQ